MSISTDTDSGSLRFNTMKSRKRIVPAKEAVEIELYILAKAESPLAKQLSVEYGPTDIVEGVHYPIAAQKRMILIEGDNYTELMSASPSWATDKPAETYRDSDLLDFIEIVEERLADKEAADSQARVSARRDQKELDDRIKASVKARRAARKKQRVQVEAERAERIAARRKKEDRSQ
jgi:hypothetical protein